MTALTRDAASAAAFMFLASLTLAFVLGAVCGILYWLRRKEERAEIDAAILRARADQNERLEQIIRAMLGT